MFIMLIILVVIVLFVFSNKITTDH